MHLTSLFPVFHARSTAPKTLAALLCLGCVESSPPTSTTDAGRLHGHASPDSSTTTTPEAGELCCKPSPEPDCCMDYGGTKNGGCGQTCDGMPWPDADWHLGVNADGCSYWVEPAPRSEYDCCGCGGPPIDASTSTDPVPTTDASTGLDASTDASIGLDASTDAATTDGAVRCCPISPEPDCCMDYGGSEWTGCGTECDGMPWPDADWRLEVNEDGCPHWVAPEPRSEYDCCGCPLPPEAGTADPSPGDASLSDSGAQ